MLKRLAARGKMSLAIGLLLGAAGCASTPPVQEMSDARQAVQAAREADAQHRAPISLGEAERLLQQATRQLEMKAYREARESALAAKEMALKARQASSTREHNGVYPDN